MLNTPEQKFLLKTAIDIWLETRRMARTTPHQEILLDQLTFALAPFVVAYAKQRGKTVPQGAGHRSWLISEIQALAKANL